LQTNLSESAKALPGAEEAERILRNCVHCGFCNATCPTYQILGNELDGPRGRIYLIKQLLEGQDVTEKTQEHLDRCLTCRNCETTCPSGVKYHTLLDIGRAEVERRVTRPTGERLLRAGLQHVIPRARVFGWLLRAGRLMHPLLPRALGDKVPTRVVEAKIRPQARHRRRMLILEGCVQPSLSPNTNAATARVLDRLGISIMDAPQAGCCGANEYHLNAQEAGRARARRNINAWWPAIEAGVEAIIQTASGCGAFVKEYVDLLRDDPFYAGKAARVSALSKDISEILADEPLEELVNGQNRRIAFHCPCTLQHAQKLGGAVESILERIGYRLTEVPDSHLCCGSAGTYSITQPKLAAQLRDRKVAALESGSPDLIVTANIGCQTHLASASGKEVCHWIEVVEEALAVKE
jgi:glycolate oxidase iron-sulfur subunit